MIEAFEEKDTSEQIMSKIKNGDWTDILEKLCYVNDNYAILDYKYFKHFAVTNTYTLIINYITTNLDDILKNYPCFNIQLNVKNLTIVDLDKHKLFIQQMSIYFKEKYPNKLLKCYIYNAPFIFSQLFNIVSKFIDKETQQKIELISANV